MNIAKNTDEIAEYVKQYRLEHKDELKQYYENHKDEIKQYYENNKVLIVEYLKQKITCECGCVVRRSCLSGHKLSKKHQELINNK